jgi:hypothetical protein
MGGEKMSCRRERERERERGRWMDGHMEDEGGVWCMRRERNLYICRD